MVTPRSARRKRSQRVECVVELKSRRRALLLAALGVLGVAAAAQSQAQESLIPPPAPPPVQVADLVRGVSAVGAHPFPAAVTSVPGPGEIRHELFFWATDDVHGTELWTLDEASLQPRRLTDLCPGPCDSGPAGPVLTPPWAGDPLLVVADDGATGTQLWRVERSGGAAVRLSGFNEFGDGESLSILLTEALLDDGRVPFIVSSGGSSRGAWSTDGTREGTRPLWDLEDFAHLTMREFYDLGEHMVFAAHSQELGTEWYRTDGAGALPELIRDVCPGPCPSTTSTPTQLGERIVFRWLDQNAAVPGWRTWVTDGEVAYALDDACGNACDFSAFSRVDGLAYFFHDDHLWRTDGTLAGTSVIASLPPGERVAFAPIVEIDGAPAVLLFDQDFDDSLWRVEFPLVTFPPYFTRLAELGPGNFQLVSTGNQLMVLSTSHNRLWLSDGTPQGTELVELGEPSVPHQGNPSSGVAVGERFYFSAAASDEGRELWTSDGTATGTRLVADLVGDPASALPRDFAVSRGSAGSSPGVFWSAAASSGEDGGEWVPLAGRDLWFLPRGEAEPKKLFSAAQQTSDFFEGVFDPQPVGGGLLFSVYVPDRDRLTWWSDGTLEGTVPLGTALDGPSLARDPVECGGLVYFAAERGAGEKLWVTDGTPEGTQVVLDIDPAWVNDFYGCPICSPPGPPGPIFPRELTLVGSRMLFAAVTEEHGAELWSSDGTAEGTSMVADLSPGDAWSDPTALSRVGDSVLFLTKGQEIGAFQHSTELWSSNGTAAGTTRLAHFEDLLFVSPRHETPSPTRIEDLGDGRRFAVIFAAEREAPRVWLGDAATETLHEVPIVGRLRESVGSAGRLFLALGDLEEGSELWMSNASFDGLARLAVRQGQRSAGVSELTALPRGVVFTADDGVAGHELWRFDLLADGTPNGAPYLLADVRPGPASASPSELLLDSESFDAHDARLFFSAFSQDSGREPWVLPLLGVGTPVEPLCQEDTRTVCIDDRFQVRAFFRSPTSAHEEPARAVPEARADGATGFFSFFNQDNLELAVKVLDGEAINAHHWLYYGALSDVAYRIEAQDLLTGALREYVNEQGTLCGQGDIEAFPLASGPVVAPIELRQQRVVHPSSTSCADGPDRLCLQQRFVVEVTWHTDAAGQATAVPYGAESGSFWFFDPSNLELVVKILDGRHINGRYWLYYGGLSDVEYEITITDTMSGAQRIYRNAQGTLCGGADIELF